MDRPTYGRMDNFGHALVASCSDERTHLKTHAKEYTRDILRQINIAEYEAISLYDFLFQAICLAASVFVAFAVWRPHSGLKRFEVDAFNS